MAPAPPGRTESVPAGRIVLGLALLLPALIAWLWSYLLPTLSTVLLSFQEVTPSRTRPVGVENYQEAFESGLVGQVGFALLLGLLPLAFALLVAPLLAIAADRAGRTARLVTRGVLALPIAGYAPVVLHLGWQLRDASMAGPVDGRGSLVWAVAAISFGLVVAVAVTLYLSALRHREPGGRPSAALPTVGGLLALGIIAVSLQSYTAPALLTSGGPDNETVTPLFGAVQQSFNWGQFGPGMAISTVLLVVLGVLGLGATGLLLKSGARIEFDGGQAARGDRVRPARLVPVVLALVGFLVFLGWVSVPLMAATITSGTELPGDLNTVDVMVNTWLPTFVSALVSVGIAALAGFGIGAVRPLGRWSELLLLPFAPWLFVGVGPLALAGFRRTQDFDQLNSFLGLIPPTWLSVPALFACTLLFRGQHAAWRAGRGFGRTLILPALPMLTIAFVLTWLVNSQQPLWSTVVAMDRDSMTATNLAQLGAQQFDSSNEMLSLVLPMPIMVLLLLTFAALQIGYLDRLVLRFGTSKRPAGTD